VKHTFFFKFYIQYFTMVHLDWGWPTNGAFGDLKWRNASLWS